MRVQALSDLGIGSRSLPVLRHPRSGPTILSFSCDGIETAAKYVIQFSDGGYTTNVPLEDVMGGKAWVAFGYGGEPLPPQHGGPARVLVPHLYFWKSAKWVRGLRLQAADEPGFWETNGYHNYGDPWREQRYWGD